VRAGFGSLLIGLGALICTTPGARGQEPEPRLAGLELVLHEVHSSGRLDAQVLLDALLIAGPRGQDELMEALGPTRGILATSRRTELERALVGVPRLVLERAEMPGLAPRRVELERHIALRILEEQGSANDLQPLMRLVTPQDPKDRLDPRTAQRLTRTVARLSRRDGSTLTRLRQLFGSLDPRLQPTVLLGVGEVESPETLRFLGEQLGEHEHLELILMAQIGRIGEALGTRPDERTRTQLLMELASTKVARRREACVALGRLEEPEATADLILLLDDDDPGVAHNAHWALERISAKRLAADRLRWQRWFDDEREWWSSRATPVFADLESGDPVAVSRAIRELAAQRLHRDHLASRLAPHLHSSNDVIVLQALAALRNLRSRACVDALEGLLGHGTPRVAEEARSVLEDLLGAIPAG